MHVPTFSVALTLSEDGYPDANSFRRECFWEEAEKQAKRLGRRGYG